MQLSFNEFKSWAQTNGYTTYIRRERRKRGGWYYNNGNGTERDVYTWFVDINTTAIANGKHYIIQLVRAISGHDDDARTKVEETSHTNGGDPGEWGICVYRLDDAEYQTVQKLPVGFTKADYNKLDSDFYIYDECTPTMSKVLELNDGTLEQFVDSIMRYEKYKRREKKHDMRVAIRNEATEDLSDKVAELISKYYSKKMNIVYEINNAPKAKFPFTYREKDNWNWDIRTNRSHTKFAMSIGYQHADGQSNSISFNVSNSFWDHTFSSLENCVKALCTVFNHRDNVRKIEHEMTAAFNKLIVEDAKQTAINTAANKEE